MAAIQSFRDLDVYQTSRERARRLFELTKRLPKEERYSLTDQVRRSSRAVSAMVAEAWAFRRYEAAFVNKLHQAMGESNETQAWLDSALDCGYIDEREHADFDDRWQHVGAMLRRMVERSSSFCVPAEKP